MNFLFGSDAYTIPIGHKLSAGAYMHNYTVITVSDMHLGGFLLFLILICVFVAVILINVVNARVNVVE
jgi:hypothetical protein